MKLPFFKKEEPLPSEALEAKPYSILDIIAPPAIEENPDHLRIGEKLSKSFFIFSYPEYLSTVWLSPVINLDLPMDLSLFTHPLKTGDILKQLRKKITEVEAEVTEREEKGLIRSPKLEAAYKELEDLRDKLTSAQERVFDLGVYLTIYADNEKELSDAETQLRSILEARLVYLKPALYQQSQGFTACSPFGLDTLAVHTPMNTETLSAMFPFVSFDLSSNEGILYGINMHNNSLVLFDRFSLESPNFVLFGKAGSGKSVCKDEPVIIKDQQGRTKQVKIGKLVENQIKEHGATKIDKEMEGVIDPELEVFTFNKDLKGEWSKVTVAARKKAPKTLYKLKTQSGREITTTGDHNMVTLRNGRVGIAKSSEIKKGEYIPLPKRILVNEGGERNFNLLKLLRNSRGVYVENGGFLIKEHYRELKQVDLDQRLDRYLYRYKDGQRIPVSYFLKILSFLNIEPDSPKLKQLRVSSRNGRASLNIILPIKPNLLRVLGFITAEGTVKEDVVMVSNQNPQVLQQIDQDLTELNTPFFYGNRGIIIAARLFIEIVKSLQGKAKSGKKRVPTFIFNQDQERIAAYLSAYFEGDGTVGTNGEVTATSKSKQLISDLSYLLYRFGIVARIRKKFKRATNTNHKGNYYYQVVISGQKHLNRFAEKIGFITKEKNKELQKYLGKEYNTNVDVIPNLNSIFKEIQQLFPPLLYNISSAHEWKRGKRRPSPEHLIEVIGEIEKRVQNFKDLGPTFKTLKELPQLTTIINLGKNDKKLNSALWKILDDSWGLMKNREVKPRSENVFKAIEVINGDTYCLGKIKQKIRQGFKKMALPIKYYNPSLQPALVENPESNTQYEMIQKSAHYVWDNYQEILNQKIPQVEEKLAQLKVLANSDLFWDPIVEIKEIENKDEYVYDLTVDNEVFLAGFGGMFVHNSYAIKLEILRSLMQKVNAIVLDPENEYEFLADAVGGSFLDFSLTGPHHINPFALPKVGEDERPEDVLRSNIINLVGLLRIMLGGLNAEEDAIVDRALTETYAAKDITPGSNPEKWGKELPYPLMSDFQDVLETMEGAESLVKRIRKFTEGTYAGFFNHPTNIEMDRKLMVFGIKNMEEELREMAMYIILRHIWKTITSKLRKRLLIIDEAWWLMQTEDGASFLYGTAKRARKYWLGMTTITQDVIDFMKSDYGKPIIQNSSLQLLMKQSPAAMDLVQKTFNLTDQEKNRLLECEVGEGIFFAGTKHIALRVVASYTEDQIITTSPEEVVKIKEAKRKLKASR